MSTDKTVSTAPTVSSEKPSVRDLVTSQRGQNLADGAAMLAEIASLRSQVAKLKFELEVAEAENDRLVTENLTIKSQRKEVHRKLWDAVHKVLVQHSPGTV